MDRLSQVVGWPLTKSGRAEGQCLMVLQFLRQLHLKGKVSDGRGQDNSRWYVHLFHLCGNLTAAIVNALLQIIAVACVAEAPRLATASG